MSSFSKQTKDFYEGQEGKELQAIIPKLEPARTYNPFYDLTRRVSALPKRGHVNRDDVGDMIPEGAEYRVSRNSSDTFMPSGALSRRPASAPSGSRTISSPFPSLPHKRIRPVAIPSLLFDKQVKDFARQNDILRSIGQEDSDVPFYLEQYEDPLRIGEGRERKVRLNGIVSESSIEGPYEFKSEQERRVDFETNELDALAYEIAENLCKEFKTTYIFNDFTKRRIRHVLLDLIHKVKAPAHASVSDLIFIDKVYKVLNDTVKKLEDPSTDSQFLHRSRMTKKAEPHLKFIRDFLLEFKAFIEANT